MKNQAANPGYSSELARLRLVLDQWLTENDKGIYPEDSAEINYWVKDADNAYLQKMKSFNLPVDIQDEEFLKWWEKRLKVDNGKNNQQNIK
jgi:hypothetical protein